MNILNKLGLQRIPKPYIESNETAEKIARISKALVDLQKLATGEIHSINLQTVDILDVDGADLTNDDLDIVKRILDVPESGNCDFVDIGDDRIVEIKIYSTKITNVKYTVTGGARRSPADIMTGITVSVDLVFESPFEE